MRSPVVPWTTPIACPRATTLVRGGIASRVLAAHQREETGAEIRLAEGDLHLARRRDGEPPIAMSARPAIERRNHLAELQRLHVERPAQRRRQLAGEIHLEADDLAAIRERIRRSRQRHHYA